MGKRGKRGGLLNVHLDRPTRSMSKKGLGDLLLDSHFLVEPFGLGVVAGLDLLLVREFRLNTFVAQILEAVRVEGEVALAAGDVGHGHGAWRHLLFIGDLEAGANEHLNGRGILLTGDAAMTTEKTNGLPPNDDWGRRGSVARIVIVVDAGDDVSPAAARLLCRMGLCRVLRGRKRRPYRHGKAVLRGDFRISISLTRSQSRGSSGWGKRIVPLQL